MACDFTSKAAEAAGVETDARVAAAVLLLDQAIVADQGHWPHLDELAA